MSLTDWAGYDSLHDINHDEQEPYVLPIILHLEKDDNLRPSHEEAQLATAYAIVNFFGSPLIIKDGEWAEATNKWLNGRIRKVARRARGSEWENLKNVTHIRGTYGKAEVIILSPHANFEPPSEIKKLQISGMDLEKQAQQLNSHNIKGLQFAINPAINMSTGKTLAQVGHAVQLAIFNSDKSTIESWIKHQTPIHECKWEDENDWVAEIHDAGFTEIPAGSLTAKSLIKL